MRLRIGFEQARAVQEFQNMAIVLSKAFGGKPKNGPTNNTPAEVVHRPRNMGEMMNAFARVIGGKR